MMGLTPRQHDCLEAIGAFKKRVGRMPSLHELGEELGITTRSGVAQLLVRLEQRGYVKRIPGAHCAILVRRNKCPHCGGKLQPK